MVRLIPLSLYMVAGSCRDLVTVLVKALRLEQSGVGAHSEQWQDNHEVVGLLVVLGRALSS